MNPLRHYRRGRGRPRHPDVLTPAEWRVLEHVREGRSNAEIAERLGVSINTVRTQVSAILAKLDVPDRYALAGWRGQPAQPTRRRLPLALPLLAWLRERRGGLAGAGRVTAAVTAAAVAAVVLVAALQVARDRAEPPAGAATTETPAPEVPAEGAVPSPTPLAAATSPPRWPEYGAWIIEVDSGAVTRIHQDDEPAVVGAWAYQGFTPDGTGVWLSYIEQDRAVRYSLEGAAQETIDGANLVLESPAGGNVFARAEDGTSLRMIGVEAAGRRFEAPGGLVLSAFSPDDQYLAYWEREDDTGTMRLMLMDLTSGQSEELVRGVGARESDAWPPLAWSPSGRFLIYADFGQWPPDEQDERPGAGAFLLNMQTRESMRLTPEPLGVAYPAWLPDRDVTAFSRETEVVLFDAATGEETALLDREPGAFASVEFDPTFRLVIVRESSGPPWQTQTAALAVETGAVEGRWGGAATLVSPSGAVMVSLNEPGDGCPDWQLEIPDLTEPICFAELNGSAWSKDGEHFAFIRDGRLHTIDLVSGQLRELIEVPDPENYLVEVEWNAQGTHILIRWPFWPY